MERKSEENYTQKMRKEAIEEGERIREDIRNSKHGLLKIIGLELFPVAWGASLGSLGRATGADWIPAVPLGMDLMVNATGYTTARGLWGLTKYGIGVALPYADKVYLAAQSLIDKI